jgi:hypothetical protein
MAMMMKYDEGHRTQRFGSRIDTPSKVLIERSARLERHTEISKADLHGRAWPLEARQALQTEFRSLAKLHMRNAAESPLRFAFGCFPPASPAFVPEAGKQKTTPKDPSQRLICLKKNGAGEGIRTLDPHLGNALVMERA